jgi:hypothetical protein
LNSISLIKLDRSFIVFHKQISIIILLRWNVKESQSRDQTPLSL